ncbi:MAG: hypothetical protein ACP5NS_00855 [Candidatus Pacearchaeota archaeon]
MSYNPEKIKKFHEYTLEDYKRSMRVEDLASVKKVTKTDGSFTQIGIRPILEDDIFIDPGFSEYLPGAGRLIAIGERDFLVNAILEKSNKGEIEKIEFKEEIKEFSKHINFLEGVIVISTKFFVEIFTQLMHRIDYKAGYPRLDHQYKIDSMPESVLGNKIILIEKDAILLEKELFDNSITGKKEEIDIKIKSAQEIGKVDITIRSVNKISYMDNKRIKVLEVED